MMPRRPQGAPLPRLQAKTVQRPQTLVNLATPGNEAPAIAMDGVMPTPGVNVPLSALSTSTDLECCGWCRPADPRGHTLSARGNHAPSAAEGDAPATSCDGAVEVSGR